MDKQAFQKSLEAEGFSIVERDVAPNSSFDEHRHEWTVRAMITSGSFYVHTDEVQKTYTKG